MNLIAYALINGLAVFIAAYILPGVSVTSIWTAILVALVLGVVNMFIKPILFFLTLPITVITLGLFTFVLNGLIVLLVDWLVPGFSVSNFLWAMILSIVISLTSSFLGVMTKQQSG